MMLAFIQSLGSAPQVVVEPEEPPVEETLTLELSETSTEITGIESWADVSLRNVDLHYKGLFQWSNGKTFLPYETENTVRPFGQARILPYDELGGVGRPRIVGTVPAAADTHNVPAIAFYDGRVHVFQENVHDTPLEHYRGQAGLDISLFESQTDIGTKVSYAHLLFDADGDAFIWARGYTPNDSGFYSIWIIEATGISSWGSQIQVTERPLGNDNFLRHYPFVPFGRYRAGGYLHLLWADRNDANVNYYKLHYAKTPDTGANKRRLFINAEGTYQRHITTDGIITDVLSDVNYTIHEMDNSTLQGGAPVVGISPEGNLYQIVKDTDETFAFSLKYFDGSWHTKAISLPWTLADYSIVTPFIGTVSPFSQMMVHSDNRIWVVVSIVEATFVRQRLIETANQGDSWTDLKGEMFEVGSINTRMLLPDNIFDIPFERNFAVAFTSVDLTDSGRARMFIKDAAFNELQPKPGITIPAVDYNPRGLGMFRYICNDANIVRSGNNVSQLTDLFGLRNATGTNNPQWNGSDRITTNGTNSYFTIASVAEIAALSSFTYIFVAKKAAANSFLLSLTDNTGSTEQMTFQIGFSTSVNKAVLQFAIPTGGAIGNRVESNDVFGDNADHVVAYVVKPNSYEILIDGRLEYFQTGLTSADTLISWQQIGKGPSSISTINAANIGRRDLTTDSFTPTDFKKQILYGGVLTENELNAIIKDLCTADGITYQNEYVLA